MPKEKPDISDESDELRKRSKWSDDQEDRRYYYDDSHGYKDYVPDLDDEEFED
ncbi:MAG: hypothetical protein ACT4O9_16550 [Blastocatellia bacterium]